jgi:lipid-A-disaccharide synthase-like uncharacterized protein
MRTKTDLIIYSIGFAAQILFGSRIVLQWLLSEKKRQSTSPVGFWVLSLAGSLLFLFYGLMREDWVIIAGQSISFYVYVKNLQLKQYWQYLNPVLQKLILFMPVLVIVLFFGSYHGRLWPFQGGAPAYLLVVGFAGQFLMSARFVYQLFQSVRTGQSVMPSAFWFMSLSGSMLLLVYAGFRKDPVLFIAQSFSLIPYARNLYFSAKADDVTP